MIDVEERFRAGLEDGGWDRPVPPEAMRWIAAEASRQRIRRLPVIAAAASVAAGAVFVATTQLNQPSAATYGNPGPEATPSSCPGFVHPGNGVPVWPNELEAVIRAAADFDAWRIAGSRSVADCGSVGSVVGAVVSLEPAAQGSGASLEAERVIGDQVTASDLPALATAGLENATAHDGPPIQGADFSLVAVGGNSIRVLAWSTTTHTVVTITQSSEATADVTATARKLADLAGPLLTMYYRTRD
jgi:hypothetical protein